MLVDGSTAWSCVGAGRIINPMDSHFEARSLEVARIYVGRRIDRSTEVMESSIMGKTCWNRLRIDVLKPLSPEPTGEDMLVDRLELYWGRASIGPVVSKEKMFENVDDNTRQRNASTVSSPISPRLS